MVTIAGIWFQFIFCAALIGGAGYQLSRCGDAIAQRTGLSGSWIGIALLATVTSTPELVTGITSVTIANAPNLALGDALGSCTVNLLFVVGVDFFVRQEQVRQHSDQGHVVACAFGVVMLGYTLVSLQMCQATTPLGFVAGVSTLLPFFIGLMTPALLVFYVLAMRTIYFYERVNFFAAETAEGGKLLPLEDAVPRFAFAAFVVAGAGIWLPFLATDLANSMGWNKSFVGSLFVAAATSVPELVVTLSALRSGAIDMAIGNLLGSNLFNLAIIGMDDLLYRPGILLAEVSPVHSVTASAAITMTGMVMLGLLGKSGGRVLGFVNWIRTGLVAMYLLNTWLLYLDSR